MQNEIYMLASKLFNCELIELNTHRGRGDIVQFDPDYLNRYDNALLSDDFVDVGTALQNDNSDSSYHDDN